MSQRPDLAWTQAWQQRLREARSAGNLELCLQLRREDAAAFDFSEHTLELALAEERDWHANRITAAERFATFEWECRRCDVRTWMPSCGGVLDWDCTCDDATQKEGQDIHIYKIFGGEREHVGTLAGFTGHTA